MSENVTAQPDQVSQTNNAGSQSVNAKNVCAIVGLQWGDEGKGKVVDLYSQQFDYVVRYNGGANAGHTVVVGDQKFALHLIPSGILSGRAVNVLGNGVVIDPEQVVKEIDELTSRDVKVAENFQISDRAHLVMPYHKLQDKLQEAALSIARGEGQKIGTTGRGIGPCYADKAQRGTAIRVGDLLKPDALRERVRHITAIKNLLLKPLAEYAGESYEPFDPESLADTLLGFGERLTPFITDGSHTLHQALNDGKSILFEGANATLLDIDHGTFPFVTSSNCSALGIPSGTGIPGHKVDEVVGIVKAYQTRVGGGPMPTEQENEAGQRIRDRGHEYGTTTGRPRRCGWLDLVALKYTAQLCGVSSFALMLFDVLAGFDELKVCTAYQYEGETLSHFPASCDVLSKVEPVYETLPGFPEEITGCRTYDELPEAARKYVSLIEAHLGVPAKLVSVGPARDQTILTGK